MRYLVVSISGIRHRVYRNHSRACDSARRASKRGVTMCVTTLADATQNFGVYYCGKRLNNQRRLYIPTLRAGL